MAEVRVTAEQAQQLLAGTTPGPWSAVHSQSGWAARPDRGYWEEDEADDIALIAAAPDLAETVIALYAERDALKARVRSAAEAIPWQYAQGVFLALGEVVALAEPTGGPTSDHY